MKTLLAVVALTGTLALAASAALADDSVNGFVDKLPQGTAISAAPALGTGAAAGSAAKPLDLRGENMDVHADR